MSSLEELRELVEKPYGLETIQAWKHTQKLLLNFVEAWDAWKEPKDYSHQDDYEHWKKLQEARAAIREAKL